MSQLIIYSTPDGKTKIDVQFDKDTAWLSQSELATLFQTTKQNISLHIKNVFKEGELQENSVVKEFLTTAHDSKKYATKYYNLDLIISVGYRIKSKIATKFRQWATAKLKEFIVKGFILDDERLKNPDLPFDYFEELTLRISDIRTSEKRFYRKITDIYATSVDYDPTADQSINFFKTVQNKVHYAITGQTAAEIIATRISRKKRNLGLTYFRGNQPTLDEAKIAKNFLREEELISLNNLVEQYLIFAEAQARRRIPMYMKDWIQKLHGFLTINDRNILEDVGNISHELAMEIVEKEFVAYKHEVNQNELIDFDEIITNLPNKLKNDK